jgi:hypothetical protein
MPRWRESMMRERVFRWIAYFRRGHYNTGLILWFFVFFGLFGIYAFFIIAAYVIFNILLGRWDLGKGTFPVEYAILYRNNPEWMDMRRELSEIRELVETKE